MGSPSNKILIGWHHGKKMEGWSEGRRDGEAGQVNTTEQMCWKDDLVDSVAS